MFVYLYKWIEGSLQTRLFSVHRYVCVWEKGYQDTDSILSSVTTKVKGIAVTNTSELGLRIWDVADYIIPPQVPSRYFEQEVQAIETPKETPPLTFPT